MLLKKKRKRKESMKKVARNISLKKKRKKGEYRQNLYKN